MQSEHHAPGHPGSTEHAHPSPRTYIWIAVVLTVITAIEVAVIWEDFPFVDWLGSLVVPILLLLSAAKFVLVVGFYMHLKFDSKIFTGFFASGLLIALTILLALLVLMGSSSPPSPGG